MVEPTLDAPSRADLAAQAWVEVCELLDLQLSPLGMRAIDVLAPTPGDVLVDIGCGAGQSVLQLAERVGPEGRVVGVDIARRLLDVAKRRADGLRQVSFLEADAQSVELPDQSADGVFSRFGVMAFADPLAALSNFQRILKPSGRLAFVCWRALEENELDSASPGRRSRVDGRSNAIRLRRCRVRVRDLGSSRLRRRDGSSQR